MDDETYAFDGAARADVEAEERAEMGARQVDPQIKLHAQVHAVRLLNELEAVLKGWALKVDEDTVDKWLDPVYTYLDQE